MAARARVTVIYPCLNEEAAVGECVDRAWLALEKAGFHGEVVVVDNGSTDRSAEIAAAHGARVVREPRRGYGSAYLRGFAEATGEYLIMLDADGTYPVEMLGQFVAAMQAGAHVVCGNRFAGLMEAGAMPWMNRYIGNPILSTLTRFLFGLPVRDVHCGMRGVRRSALATLQLRTVGMELATEMIVKAIDSGLAVREVDIPYRARIGDSKLLPFRDGWRHLEYMLMFTPSVLFLWPGAALLVGGLLVQLVLLWGPQAIWFRTWDVHTNLFGLAASLVGSTLLVLGLVTAAFGWTVGMRFRHSRATRIVVAGGDAGLRALGAVLAGVGAGLWLWIVTRWLATGFGELHAIPVLSLATSLLAAGLELLAAAFLVNVIQIRRT